MSAGASRSDGAPTPAVVVVDASGVIRFWNDAAAALTGHRVADAVGRSLDLIVPPE